MRKGKHLRKILLLCWAVLMPVQLAVAQSALQKRVSVNLNSVTINKLFDEVKKQAGVSFIYNNDRTGGFGRIFYPDFFADVKQDAQIVIFNICAGRIVRVCNHND